MPTSEIDDIFAGKVVSTTSADGKGKGKQKASAAAPGSSANTTVKKKKKKTKLHLADVDVGTSESVALSSASGAKKAKKRQRGDVDAVGDDGHVTAAEENESGRARAPPETVHDPSVRIDSVSAKRRKKEKGGIESKHTKNAAKGAGREDEARFMDSRGTGPRRQTEEGWFVYKENELGIGDEGGDTPLCPFDCECCY